jgi:hypothetical protein
VEENLSELGEGVAIKKLVEARRAERGSAAAPTEKARRGGLVSAGPWKPPPKFTPPSAYPPRCISIQHHDI